MARPWNSGPIADSDRDWGAETAGSVPASHAANSGSVPGTLIGLLPSPARSKL